MAIQMNVQIMRAFVYMKNTLAVLGETTVRQGQLELEIEKLRNYMEDILHDQNDTNKEVQAQIEAICRSLEKLADKVEDLAWAKNEPLPPIGFEAIEARRKEKSADGDK